MRLPHRYRTKLYRNKVQGFNMNELIQDNLTELTCLYCQAVHDEDALYCAQCGCILGHTLKPTKRTNLLDVASTDTGTQQRVVNLEWGTSYFHPRARLS